MLESEGIEANLFTLYKPQESGKAERLNRALINDTGAPRKFQAEYLKIAVNIRKKILELGHNFLLRKKLLMEFHVLTIIKYLGAKFDPYTQQEKQKDSSKGKFELLNVPLISWKGQSIF